MNSNTVKLKDGSLVTIREVSLEDAQQMTPLAQAIAETSKHVITTAKEFEQFTPERQQQRISRFLENPNDVNFVAVCNGQLVGNIDFTAGKRGRTAHTGSFGMGILASFRGKGLGTALMQRLMSWAERQSTLEKVCLTVFANNVAGIKLYEKFGFEQEGRQQKAVKMENGNYVDLIEMYKFV